MVVSNIIIIFALNNKIYKVMAKKGLRKKQYELHHYWDDGVTIECREFPTKKMAKQFAVDNGYVKYIID